MKNSEMKKIFAYLTEVQKTYTVNGWRSTEKTLIIDAVEHFPTHDRSVTLNVPLIKVYAEDKVDIVAELAKQDLASLWAVQSSLQSYEYVRDLLGLYGVGVEELKVAVDKAVTRVEDAEAESMLKKQIEDENWQIESSKE